ncbi:MAG: transcription-repair coupling factor [Proteobacteria bacterium]|nr:transcription-repair coupling factor [Pseudomonadota bacterium]
MSQNQENISLKSLINQMLCRDCGIDCIGLSGSDRAFFVSKLYLEHRMSFIVIVSSQKEGEMFIKDLSFFINESELNVIYFPPYNILPFKKLSYHNETAAKRISTLYRIINDDMPLIVVTTVSALLQKLIPKQEICNYAELIMAGEDIERDYLIEKLISGGYVKSAIVEEPGDFCIRGGILDIFSPLYPNPLRIELFGDTVDSLRFFSAATQRTIKIIQEAVILPAIEVILKKEAMVEIISRIRQQASALDMPVTKVRNIIDIIKKEGIFSGIEGLISLIYPKLDTFFDYIPDNANFVLVEPKDLENIAVESQEQVAIYYQTACKGKRLCVEPDSLYLRWLEVKNILLHKKPLALKMLPVLNESCDKGMTFLQYNFSVINNASINEQIKCHRGDEHYLPLADWINDKKRSGNTTVIVCSNRARADKLKSILPPYGIEAKFVDSFHHVKLSTDSVYICYGNLSSGFVLPDLSLAVITEDEIFGKQHRKVRPKKQIQAGQLLFEDLKKGEIVVHIEHGIGRFEGLVKLKIDGATNDFLLIYYRDDDKLYLPVERMNMAQKYVGVDEVQPVLDKMGGKSWERVKKRVKKSVEKIAGELLKLYSERKIKKGYAYKEINSYLQDFESGFSYEETSDQLRAIEDVLNDMKQPIPMDRLVCGDVGYGKTEVALRASFMAVNNGKQVAVLVPTTVLAEQHFLTFSERFKDYPFNAACLNRFRSIREQRDIINNLKTGKIDIVIGTHRLLQRDIDFKDLGLFVIDEEQRFGVKQKEKLKKIRTTVDVLALTATPIPRTLQMSLFGIRDISIISTPPEHRHSIITYISEFDDVIIAEAIRKELKRGGQIFFVHNDIHNIWFIAKRLKELVPEVRMSVGHGRLSEGELEREMFKFMKKEIDMLVCTTIIESGLDIPSANSILINRADRFGLAQIYQLRGRVGRADEQAYAYLFIPEESALTKDAKKRLKVLMEHSDLGAGFQIAMSDLKIRGGGTVLGASQSGHIAAVGYDMFLKLMENSMSELKGETVIESLEPEINMTLSAFIPENFIPDIDQRLSAYRRLAKLTDLKELSDFKAELIDRFGALPNEAANLLLKIMLKVLSIKAGVKRLDLTGQQLLLYFSTAHQKNPFGIVDMIASKQNRFKFTPDHVLKAKLSKGSIKSLLVQVKNILKEIAQHVNG